MEETLAFEKQIFSDLENKFMELQSNHTNAAAATFDSKRQTMAKSTDAASLRREIMAMETIQKVTRVRTATTTTTTTIIITISCCCSSSIIIVIIIVKF